jgi:hypothetical protein
VSRIEDNVPRLQAKSVHIVGYLPPAWRGLNTPDTLETVSHIHSNFSATPETVDTLDTLETVSHPHSNFSNTPVTPVTPVTLVTLDTLNIWCILI